MFRSKSIRTKSILVVSRKWSGGRGGGVWREKEVTAQWIQRFSYNENLLELTAVIVTQHCAYTEIQHIVHFTMVKTVNFVT